MTFASRTMGLLVCSAIVGLLFTGCVPKNYRHHPDFQQRIGMISAPGVLPVDVTIYEVSAGGVTEIRQEWCDIGSNNIAQALREQLADKNFDIIPIKITPAIETEIREVKALYRAVDASIRMHTYPATGALFPDKVSNFNYSVGPMEDLMDSLGVDVFLVVNCMDQVSTGGRKAVVAATVIAGALAGVQVIPAGSFTQGSVAIIDPTGAIIWYNTHAEAWQYDLRKYDSAYALVERILADLPKAK